MLSKEDAVEPQDAEKIGALFTTLIDLDIQITEELECAHTMREKFATFNRMSQKVNNILLLLEKYIVIMQRLTCISRAHCYRFYK